VNLWEEKEFSDMLIFIGKNGGERLDNLALAKIKSGCRSYE
jgi:hypothetical protein